MAPVWVIVHFLYTGGSREVAILGPIWVEWNVRFTVASFGHGAGEIGLNGEP